MPGGTVVAWKAHLAINVRNAERSVEFYGKIFGIVPSKIRSGYAKFEMQIPPLNFSLNAGAVPGSRGALGYWHSAGIDRRRAEHSSEMGGIRPGDRR
jgi:catechol 2,3-dioxygenase-like lactoylglutathione lyase family enzyme